MTFKKYLINNSDSLNTPAKADSIRGQVVIEYVIIFIAVTLAAIGFISKVHNENSSGILDVHFQEMVNKTLQ